MGDAVFEFIGKVVAYSGGAAAAAMLAFRFLGQKWIENMFQTRLDLLKHEHAKEIERLRLEINTLLGRVTKLQEREFTVVPEAWGRLHDALWRLHTFVSVFQSYPDVDRLGPERLEEFLASSKLLESERRQVREAGDKNKTYQEIIFWHDLKEVRDLYGEFHRYLQKNSLFISADLLKGFSDIDDKMWDALQRREIGKRIEDFPQWVQASRQMREEVIPELEKLKSLVHKKLQG